jgi:streptogramin lyase
MNATGHRVFTLVGALSAISLAACSGDEADEIEVDAGGDGDVNEGDAGDSCPTGGTGTLTVNVAIEAGALGDVRIIDAAGAPVGDPLTATGSRTLPSGLYSVEAYRVRTAGTLVGPAYQPAIAVGDLVCVRDTETASASVNYAREPGSARLWVTQNNGDGEQVLSFDPAQLAAAGDQTAGIELATDMPSAGPLRVDGMGRLWVGSATGVVSGFNTARLGVTSTAAPDISLDVSPHCMGTIPCGPFAMAFDADGNLWLALVRSIVKVERANLNASGAPAAAVTITSPSFDGPRGLAFDGAGNLWVGETTGAIVRFDAARLTANLAEQPADIVIYTQNPGPVMIGLGSPEGLVFDSAGNLWVGFFSGNELVRFTPAELATSKPEDAPIIPSKLIKIGVEALVTDLGLDEAGNLWLPGSSGALYRIDSAQLEMETPALVALRSAQIGNAERLILHSVPGELFITEPHVEAP